MGKIVNMASLYREHKTLFIIMAIVAFLIELEIFAVAVMKSGRQSRLQVHDHQGNIVHEADGDNLSAFNKYYFEKTFGPFTDYQVRLVTEDKPFPFRAWFVAAVGIPVGAVLLFAFVVKAYMSMVYGDKKADPEAATTEEKYASRLERVLARISRFNIFTIGFLVFLSVFLYWVVPNLLTYLGKVGVDTVARYKWVFAGIGAAVFALVVWVIYLRYLLARKSIESQAELDRYRLQLGMGDHPDNTPRIEYMDEPGSNSDIPQASRPAVEAESNRSSREKVA
jgi:hypothetical protein